MVQTENYRYYGYDGLITSERQTKKLERVAWTFTINMTSQRKIPMSMCCYVMLLCMCEFGDEKNNLETIFNRLKD